MIGIRPEDISKAADRLQGVANHTPVLTSRTLNDHLAKQLYFKCENFQRGGAFKFRGAFNAISQLSEQKRQAGIITHSSGNHAQGVALSAKLLGVRAVVVMPVDAPEIKQAATASYGAEIVHCVAIERESITAKLIEEHGYTLIHPYDNDLIIAGQGTSAFELFQEVGELDALFVPVGGGGLISGCALAAAAISPNCRVIGVEPVLADDANRSWRQNHIISLSEVPETIADGLRTLHIGERNLRIMHQYVADLTVVDEQSIITAMHYLWQRLKIVVEPSAAVAFAPLLSGSYPAPGNRIGILLSGGNVEINAANVQSSTME